MPKSLLSQTLFPSSFAAAHQSSLRDGPSLGPIFSIAVCSISIHFQRDAPRPFSFPPKGHCICAGTMLTPASSTVLTPALSDLLCTSLCVHRPGRSSVWRITSTRCWGTAPGGSAKLSLGRACGLPSRMERGCEACCRAGWLTRAHFRRALLQSRLCVSPIMRCETTGKRGEGDQRLTRAKRRRVPCVSVCLYRHRSRFQRRLKGLIQGERC